MAFSVFFFSDSNAHYYVTFLKSQYAPSADLKKNFCYTKSLNLQQNNLK